MGLGYSFQEGETKDRVAAPGKKTGENGLELKDQRKPEGSDKNYAAAVQKEEQKNQKASAQAIPTRYQAGLWGPGHRDASCAC